MFGWDGGSGTRDVASRGEMPVLYSASVTCLRNCLALPMTRGVIIYIKPSLTSDEPAAVLNYKSQYSDFPHQSTADQWFTESQFESYRALGEHIIETVFHALSKSAPHDLSKMDPKELFRDLAD